MALIYVGKGRVFRRLPAEDLTDDAIEAAAVRSLQRADDLTRDLLASGLYVVPEEPPVEESIPDEPPVEPPVKKPKRAKS